MISVLDCTLRDGGWVNGFDFGRHNMCEIEESIAKAGIEYIESHPTIYGSNNSGIKTRSLRQNKRH